MDRQFLYFQVKIEMFKANTPVAFAVFNATNSTSTDWMSDDRLMSSSWQDITEFMATKPVTISMGGRYINQNAYFAQHYITKTVFITLIMWLIGLYFITDNILSLQYVSFISGF